MKEIKSMNLEVNAITRLLGREPLPSTTYTWVAFSKRSGKKVSLHYKSGEYVEVHDPTRSTGISLDSSGIGFIHIDELLKYVK